MRLLKRENASWLGFSAVKFSLTKFTGETIPKYAILSHTWGADDEEVSFSDLVNGMGKNKIGYEKLRFCEEQAARDGLAYFWVDTCCIDKTNSTELQEAINSMFRWYRDAAKCYAYLADVSTYSSDGQTAQDPWELSFRSSRWFTRGWTLQEIIAPVSVEFFSREGKRLGDKKSLEGLIYEITGISIKALQGEPLSQFGVAERMSWAEKRQTKLSEDKAYCLLGLFGIYIPLIYGEGGDNAFVRLEEEIKKRAVPRPDTPPNVQQSLVAAPGARPKPSSTVPFRRDPDFVYRDILSEMELKCSRPASRTALVGLGGVG
jgi:hypothetical protein